MCRTGCRPAGLVRGARPLGHVGSSPLPSAPPVVTSRRPGWSALRGYALVAPPQAGGGGLSAPREGFILRRRSMRSSSGSSLPRVWWVEVGPACPSMGPCWMAAASVPRRRPPGRVVVRPMARWLELVFRQSLMVLCGLRAKGPFPVSGLRPTRTLHTACGRRSLLRAFTLVSRQLARLWRGLRSGPVRRPVGLERMGLRPVTSARRLGLGIPLSKMCPWMCAGLRPFTPARRRSFGVPSSATSQRASV